MNYKIVRIKDGKFVSAFLANSPTHTVEYIPNEWVVPKTENKLYGLFYFNSETVKSTFETLFSCPKVVNNLIIDDDKSFAVFTCEVEPLEVTEEFPDLYNFSYNPDISYSVIESTVNYSAVDNLMLASRLKLVKQLTTEEINNLPMY